MRRDGYKIYSEGQIGAMALKNRLVRSATFGDRNYIEAGRVDKLLALYRNLAQGGVGLIITGVRRGFPEGTLEDVGSAKQTTQDV